MVLFCAAIRRDSVFLLRFPFLSHVQVFSCKFSSVCRLKYPCIYFSSNFYFLVVVLQIFMLSLLFLVTVINLCFFFCVVLESSYWCIYAIFNVGESSSSFFSRHVIIISPLSSFSCQRQQVVVFHGSLCDSKFSQVTTTFLSILADLNNAMVLILPLIFNSSSLVSKPFDTASIVLTTTGITIKMFKYLSIVSLSFIFILWSAGTSYVKLLFLLNLQ